MALRSVALTLTLTFIAIVSVGVYLATQFRDGLLEQRVNQILQDTQRTRVEVQAQLDASSVANIAELRALLQGIVNRLATTERAIFTQRDPDATVYAPEYYAGWSVDNAWPISAAIRTAVQESDVQQMQYIAIVGPNQNEPGLVVGAQLKAPVVGNYELYFVYTLAPEQRVMNLIQRVMTIAGLALMALSAAIAWLVTRRMVSPVEQAAGVAVKIADGDLDQRMRVHGRDEVARLAESFNTMADSLQDQIERMEALSASQRRFVSDVSHELRTPLTTVRIAAHVLDASKSSFSPDLARSAELMMNQLDRFEALLADLLEISRFDAGAAQLDAEPTDLRDVVTRAVDLVLPLATSKGVFVSVDLPTAACEADIDPRRVERIVRNLLSNAVEHAEGKPVQIFVGASDDAVAVVIKDNGVGLSAEQMTHVFDRFWRADPARSRTTGGTGLGLAIAREDAHLHNGWLEVTGALGQGASFRLTLPRHAHVSLTRSPLTMTGSPVRIELIESGPAVLPVLDDDDAAAEVEQSTGGAR